MSKKDQDIVNCNIDKKVKIIFTVLIAAVIISILWAFIHNVVLKDNENIETQSTENIENTESIVDENSLPHSEYVYKELKSNLEDDSADIAYAEIMHIIENLENNNTYLAVQTSETSKDVYLYNKNGEIFAQSSDGEVTSVFRNDETVIKFTPEAIALGQDLDVLATAVFALKTALHYNDIDGISFYEVETVETERDYKEYRIDLVGKEAIRQVYSYMGDEFADNMLNSILEVAGENWEPHLIYTFLISGDNISFGCLVVEDDEEYTNWFVDGYMIVDDWKLDKGWYEFDEETDDDVFVESQLNPLLMGLLEDLEKMLNNFAENNGIDMEEVEQQIEEEEAEQTEIEQTIIE